MIKDVSPPLFRCCSNQILYVAPHYFPMLQQQTEIFQIDDLSCCNNKTEMFHYIMFDVVVINDFSLRCFVSFCVKVVDYLMLHVIDLRFAKDFYRFFSWEAVVASLTCVASLSDVVDQQRCARRGGWKTERSRGDCTGVQDAG